MAFLRISMCMLKDKERQKQYAREWYLRNRELTIARARAWELANPEKTAEKKQRWRKKNPENVKKHKEIWRKKNPHKLNAYVGKRRAAKLLRTPKWLTADDLFIIEEAYHVAKLRTELTNIPWHVDHILPLQGKKVSGLHVPGNIQVIPAKINLQKSNKHE